MVIAAVAYFGWTQFQGHPNQQRTSSLAGRSGACSANRTSAKPRLPHNAHRPAPAPSRSNSRPRTNLHRIHRPRTRFLDKSRCNELANRARHQRRLGFRTKRPPATSPGTSSADGQRRQGTGAQPKDFKLGCACSELDWHGSSGNRSPAELRYRASNACEARAADLEHFAGSFAGTADQESCAVVSC